jgi:5-dehydro-2-deoxygluconokinase
MLLGLEAPEAELAHAFRVARTCARVSGFAVGRTIFVEPARKWFAGAIGDAAATQAMAESFARLVAMWQDAAPGGSS